MDHGFLLDSRGRFTTIDLPGVSTSIIGINNQRQMVGSYAEADGSQHGFLRYRSGRSIDIDVPGAVATAAFDINERREVVGISVSGSLG